MQPDAKDIRAQRRIEIALYVTHLNISTMFPHSSHNYSAHSTLIICNSVVQVHLCISLTAVSGGPQCIYIQCQEQIYREIHKHIWLKQGEAYSLWKEETRNFCVGAHIKV